MKKVLSTWLHSTVPLLTASMFCGGGTISPPGKGRISNLPSVTSLTRLQSSSTEA